MEVPHPFGLELYESYTPVIAASCLAYTFVSSKFYHEDIHGISATHIPLSTMEMLQSILAGLVSCFLAYIFWVLFKLCKYLSEKIKAKVRKGYVILPLVGGTLSTMIGIVFPISLFWGQEEVVSILSNGYVQLPHWQGPTSFIFPEELAFNSFILLGTGLAKLLCITLAMNFGFYFFR